MNTPASEELGRQPGIPDDGQRYEQLGFTWCKVGSIAIIALFPKLGLLIAGCVTIYFYIRAMMLGVDKTCCILRHPMIVVGFWMLAVIADVAWIAWPMLGRMLAH